MKTARKLLLILLMLALSLSIFACGGDDCTEHIDGNGDKKCDKCGEAVEDNEDPTKITLFDNGAPNFQFVLALGTNQDVKDMINGFIEDMDDIFNVTVKSVADKEETIADCEILIGEVKSRGDKYNIDKYSLGNDGYVIKMVDSKIIVVGGSSDALTTAVETLFDDILTYDEDADSLGTLYMEEDQQIDETQEYNITALKVNGADMRGYTIAINVLKQEHKDAALKLQSTIYDRTGYWFEIVDEDDADLTKSIYFKSVDPVAGEGGFKVLALENGQLAFECMYENKLAAAIEEFITKKIILVREGEINFTGNSIFTYDISVLKYEDFGAKGDGRTDDFRAIYETHVSANKFGQSVKATSGKKYYIKENTIIVDEIEEKINYVAIPIMTDTDWTGATFIIDDTEIDLFEDHTRAMGTTEIFEVRSSYSSFKIKDRATLDAVAAAGLNRNSTKVDLGLGYPAMIVPNNSQNKVFRRLGYGQFAGSDMFELIVIDKDGNIDLTSESRTPLMFDYTYLDHITVHRIDDTPITIRGGTVINYQSRVDSEYLENGREIWAGYISRGLNVKRSYTTVDGLKHKIEKIVTPIEQVEQGLQPAPYQGFFYAKNATNVTFKNCEMMGRRYYDVQGTYEFGANLVNKVVLDNCIQTNFWVTYDPVTGAVVNAEKGAEGALPSQARVTANGQSVTLHWGLGGTNYCKNMEFLNSVLSRYDAHAGVYNGKIINCDINSMELTGIGDFVMENTNWFTSGTNSSIFFLRNDYGTTWEGTIYAKNINAYMPNNASLTLIFHQYRNWYWGYNVFVPNLVLDNLRIYDIDTFDPVASGRSVTVMTNTLTAEPAMHLQTTINNDAIYPYVDYNEDGLVDNTDHPYLKSLEADYWNGVSVPGRKDNLSVVGAPEYIKILNNNAGYKFVVTDTYGTARSADPEVELPADVAEMGGFFGFTKFYYTETDYVRGTGGGNIGPFDFR